jgi:hypothetical protein
MAIGGSTLVLLLVFLHRNPAAVHRFPMFFLNGIGARPRWFSLWLVAVTLLAAANGVAPYLELRTAAAFNMYSNLRVVDGSSNHFLFNPGLLGLDGPISEESVGSATSDAIGDTPADPGTGERPSYVGIETVDDGSALDYYRQAELLVPSENLHRYLVVHQEESPTIRLGREAVSARSLGYGQVERDPGLGSAIADLIGRKLGFRRAIPDPAGLAAGGSGRCLREWGPIG